MSISISHILGAYPLWFWWEGFLGLLWTSGVLSHIVCNIGGVFSWLMVLVVWVYYGASLCIPCQHKPSLHSSTHWLWHAAKYFCLTCDHMKRSIAQSSFSTAGWKCNPNTFTWSFEIDWALAYFILTIYLHWYQLYFTSGSHWNMEDLKNTFKYSKQIWHMPVIYVKIYLVSFFIDIFLQSDWLACFFLSEECLLIGLTCTNQGLSSSLISACFPCLYSQLIHDIVEESIASPTWF